MHTSLLSLWTMGNCSTCDVGPCPCISKDFCSGQALFCASARAGCSLLSQSSSFINLCALGNFSVGRQTNSLTLTRGSISRFSHTSLQEHSFPSLNPFLPALESHSVTSSSPAGPSSLPSCIPWAPYLECVGFLLASVFFF